MSQRKRLINVYIYLFLHVGRGSAVLSERIWVASDNEINRENCTFIERTWEFYPFCKIPVTFSGCKFAKRERKTEEPGCV